MAGTEIQYGQFGGSGTASASDSVGSVTLKDVLTRSVTQEVVYDSTGLDPIYTKIVIEVDTTLIGKVAAGVIPTLGFGDTRKLADVIRHVQGILLTPRRHFKMTVGGVTLFDVNPAESETGTASAIQRLGNTDVNNGPKLTFTVNEIISGKVARCTVRCEMAVPNCKSAILGGANPGLISLRFWTSDELDENWYVTRTFHGRLRVASKNFEPHSFRHLIFPPVGDGFKRKSVNVAEDPNGLELEFTVVDQEFFMSCPAPATTWSGKHTVSSPYAGTIIGIADVHVTLEGPRNTSKAELIQLAVQIIDNKLQLDTGHLATSGLEGRAVLLYYAIEDTLHLNRITATAKVRVVQASTSTGNIFSDTMGQPVTIDDYNLNRSRTWNPSAATNLTGIVLQSLGSSCSPPLPGFRTSTSSSSKNGSTSYVAHGEETSVTAELRTLDKRDNSYSPETDAAAYNVYMLSSEVFIDQGTAGLPVGSTSSSSKSASLVVVQLHEPTGSRKIRVIAERLSEPPKIPKPLRSFTMDGILNTLKSWKLVGSSVTLAGDGVTPIYRVEGVIDYWLDNAPDPDTNFIPVGQNPAIENGKVVNMLPPTIFSKTLTEAARKK